MHKLVQTAEDLSLENGAKTADPSTFIVFFQSFGRSKKFQKQIFWNPIVRSRLLAFNLYVFSFQTHTKKMG